MIKVHKWTGSARGGNGSGRLLLKDNTLYAKEHNGKTLYALDPSSGELKWSADKLKLPDSGPSGPISVIYRGNPFLID